MVLNDLSGSLPDELWDLSVLRSLNLAFNELTGEISEDIGRLASLEALYLVENELTGEIPDTIGNLEALSVIDLGDNRLSGPIPTTVGGARLLELLDLSDNDLSGPIPAEIGTLSRLVRLELQGNELTGEIPAFAPLVGLEFFNLSRNQLTGDVTPAFLLLDSLRSVDISDGPGGNDCFFATDEFVTAVLNDFDPGWDRCEAMEDGCMIDGVAVDTTLPQIECDSLVAFYDGLDGPNWTTNDGWNLSLIHI